MIEGRIIGVELVVLKVKASVMGAKHRRVGGEAGHRNQSSWSEGVPDGLVASDIVGHDAHAAHEPHRGGRTVEAIIGVEAGSLVSGPDNRAETLRSPARRQKSARSGRSARASSCVSCHHW